MRLIDADKLKRTEGMFQYQINDAFDRLSASAYRFEDVENAPTVEAIPVSFLERLIFEAKQSKELLKEEYRYFTSIYGHTIEPITCDQAISLIEGIIDYWQDEKQRGKENEAN